MTVVVTIPKQRQNPKWEINILRFKPSGMWYFLLGHVACNISEGRYSSWIAWCRRWKQYNPLTCWGAPTTWHHIPENLNLQQHHSGNLNSHTLKFTHLLN